ncbi:MAG TPA: FtsW/RodA/SpoVE family cell cycle protein, partial [Oscillospiraceae bacterium]|nr:FtsW/RodA/SpoVE family cell cycle protein [Oscillospiraceae bacterium]
TSYIIIVKRQMGDQYIFLIISMLTGLGIIMLFRLNPDYGFAQIKWYGFGIVLYFASYILFRTIKNWDRYIYVYIIGSMLLFLMTFTLGINIKGSINWVRIGDFTFQPAEATKIFFVFFIAAYYNLILDSKETEDIAEGKDVPSSKKDMLSGSSTGKNRAANYGNLIKNKQIIKNKYVFLIIIYSHLFLLLAQRELGMTVLFYVVFISIFYIYEEDYKLLFYNIGALMIILVLSYFTLSHVKIRLTTWINPWKQISGKGYQITQSLFAITTGGFFGTGLGLGNPAFIPAVHTDFIFSAICEEMGLFGGMAVVLLYFILIYRGFKIALTIKDSFRKIVALGITLIYGYQTFIIIGGVIKLIPLTGITLPFISYGGSSLISAFIAFGILQAISKGTSRVIE